MIKVRVASRARAAEGIAQLDLVCAEGRDLPAFEAGAHIDLFLGNGLTRQYSLCSDPAERSFYRIAVLRELTSRGGSAYVHEALTEGATLEISPPRNLFALDETAEEHLLFAGGVGVTPILAMAKRLSALGRAFTFHYCARDRSRAAFLNELSTAPFTSAVRLSFDAEPDTRLDLDVALARPKPGRRLYVCGPGGFMTHVIDGALARGWSGDQIRKEHFAAAPLSAGQDQPFELVIASSGQIVTVAADQTAAQALEAAGVFVPVSCEQGVCGTCLTRVIDGQPDHRDAFQTDEERAANDQFTPCCSRARSPRLVLDL
ncbi:PDR/VanB family oxidoreductase [Caulobacter vibrioides]|uniref:Vanillate O-demethylase, reductase subunit n=2 Tax=Caulobacter vibrioides TaxID=155892 RepID=Q9A5Q3_CAUVC|nr:PDR/VanB family oxidoreductase [Caulobacter vibrioides]YP_002517850.1 vanillate demethylase oxidoreductase subunit vanB [Caulobacter vibrioides NA1000]AAK24365.1 vanillate O-demethylase, reductase subunit [Caulobacter vibrioides CB15]ACL95942.1 vanillate demethylase oxidoreductase subunit vanB [Caulobacter vibrioides NA1000]ATC29250.1 oxidoreductase [Caulobacter vibrioides]QXZ50761.1 PDR/VanB family oxidoreductase [Caulobacter vibrioides]